MPEILLHYIWQQRLFAGYAQHTTDGRRIEVLSVGEHNLDAGPDFTNVHLRIYNVNDDANVNANANEYIDWFGNIEIHVHSSDWYRHHHERDAAYDDVVLHVVRDADRVVLNSRGQTVPQCELRYPEEQDYLTDLLHDARLMDSPIARHTCSHRLLQEPSLLTDGWRRTLLRHRLNCKAQSIRRLLDITKNDHAQAFYITLAHYFGFHTNGIPFEQLAIATPLIYLQKHRNSLFQLTAMLLGQSGLLENSDAADRDALWREYCFLQKKFSLTPLEAKIWKHARMRPQNFPEVRIRQFAHLLWQSEHLLDSIMSAGDIDALRELFTLRAADSEQYPQMQQAPQIGDASIDILIINAVVPYRFARLGEEDAIRILESLPAEKNNVIRQWQLLGQRIHSAADTQALIHLYVNYCADTRCVNCDVAYQIFLQNR